MFNDFFLNPTTFSIVNFLYLVVTVMKVVICITPGPKGCQTEQFFTYYNVILNMYHSVPVNFMDKANHLI